MTMKIRPISDHVLVEPFEEKQDTKGGIVIPDNAREEPQQGRVLAVGPGKRNDDGRLVAVGVKVGDTVLMRRYGGADLEHEDRKYKILDAEDILAIIG